MIYLFEKLNEKLKAKNLKGELGLVGGAVMCLVYNARASTKDVDAIFEPSSEIRKIAEEISKEEGLEPSWLNDGAKAYIRPNFRVKNILELSHLEVWCPEASYMLAMKCISHDQADARFLVKLLKLNTTDEVFKIVENYYPKSMISEKAVFFIEELFY